MGQIAVAILAVGLLQSV